MDFIHNTWSKARRAQKTIVLPESTDARILKACEIISKSSLANIILLGREKEVKDAADVHRINISNIKIIDPPGSEKFEQYKTEYKKLRESKGMTIEEADRILREAPWFYGAMMVRRGEADGMVSGATHPTGETVKAAIQCIGMKEDISWMSSFFVMISHKKEHGTEGILFYADCAVTPDPTSEQLADIAISTADSFRKLIGRDPRVAMLSFSTKGSAKHPSVDKVRKATEIAASKRPELMIDGELQADAALVKSIATSKAPRSTVAGRANILIFPNLDAGNICYKITQRLGDALALGPIFQGIAKPVNDLSRGCSTHDIVNVVAITALQCS
ncbi:phosphate acetyltransferase [Candidatus Margulisiibacteriota bacterium]